MEIFKIDLFGIGNIWSCWIPIVCPFQIQTFVVFLEDVFELEIFLGKLHPLIF